MSSHFLSWRQRLTATCAGFALSTPAFAAPLDIHWPELTFTWPPSPPDMLLIGSGIVLVLALAFAITRSARKPPVVHAQEDLRWWKNPPPVRDPRDDTISLPPLPR